MSFVDQLIQSIAWVLAMIEALLAIYLFVLNPRHTSTQWISFYLVIVAIDSFFTGVIIGAERMRQAYGPMLILAATSPLILTMLLALVATLFKPDWLQGRWRWAWWFYGGFMAIPAILCLADVMIDRIALNVPPLYFSGIAQEAYSGGFVMQAVYTQGLFSLVLRVLIYGPVFLALLGLLISIGISRKQFTSENRNLAWVLFTISLVAGVASLFLDRWITASLVTLVVSAILALAYGYAGYHKILSEEAHGGSLKIRLSALVLIIIAPLSILVFSTLSRGLMAINQQQVEKNLANANLAVSRNTSLWLQNNNRILQTLVSMPSILDQDVATLSLVLKSLVGEDPSHYLISVIDMEGRSIARSDSGLQQDYGNQSWFESVIKNGLFFQGLVESGPEAPALVTAMPIRNSNGEITRVAAISVDLASFADQVGVTSFESTGLVYIVDEGNRVVVSSNQSYQPVKADLNSEPVVVAIRNDEKELIKFEDTQGAAWLAYGNELENGWGVVTQQAEATLFEPAKNVQRLSTGILIAGLLLLIGLMWWTLRQNLQPIHTLTEAATAITSGELGRTVSIPRQEELGSLSEAFNNMSLELRQQVMNLKTRVVEGTQDLERRTDQLEVAAQVARSAAAIRDLRVLLTETTKLISERFDYYHVGIFILDDAGEYAVLQAVNSEGGRHMLERGHKLRVGQEGIVGYVAQTGRPRIALDVGVDAVYFNNPDLPETRSEMTLPLKVSGQVIGVLDVQSTQPVAFTNEDANVLQVLADQVALAMESARVLEESQRAYHELDALYGQQTLSTWKDRLHRGTLKYRYNRIGVFPVQDTEGGIHSASSREAGPEGIESASTSTQTGGETSEPGIGRQVQVPLSLRGQILGTVILRRDSDQKPWTEEDLAVAIDAIDQITPALENARLLEEIQQRAQQESLVGQMTARIQSTLDLDGVMKAAVREIGMAVNASRVQIRLSAAAWPSSNSGGAIRSSDQPSGSDDGKPYGESTDLTGGNGPGSEPIGGGNPPPEDGNSC